MNLALKDIRHNPPIHPDHRGAGLPLMIVSGHGRDLSRGDRRCDAFDRPGRCRSGGGPTQYCGPSPRFPESRRVSFTEFRRFPAFRWLANSSITRFNESRSGETVAGSRSWDLVGRPTKCEWLPLLRRTSPSARIISR